MQPGHPRCVGIVSVHARSWIRINELRHVLCIYDCQCAFWFVPLHICPSPLRSSDPEDPLPGRMLLYKATKPGFSFFVFFFVLYYFPVYWCMSAVIMACLVSSVKWLAGKNFSDMTTFCRVGHKTLTQSISFSQLLVFYLSINSKKTEQSSSSIHFRTW